VAAADCLEAEDVEAGVAGAVVDEEEEEGLSAALLGGGAMRRATK
jgi:hypothetical protein